MYVCIYRFADSPFVIRLCTFACKAGPSRAEPSRAEPLRSHQSFACAPRVLGSPILLRVRRQREPGWVDGPRCCIERKRKHSQGGEESALNWARGLFCYFALGERWRASSRRAASLGRLPASASRVGVAMAGRRLGVVQAMTFLRQRRKASDRTKEQEEAVV